MAAIKNVKYLNKECIYQYFHNPNEAFLEGFIVDENPIFCPRNCESGVYIKIFKVPVNSRVNEIYMQEFRWEAWKNGYNTPLPSDYSNNFKKAGYSIDSTRFWSLPNYLISVCPKLKAELIDYQQQFEQAYCKKIIEELSFCHALSDGKETNERAEQYAIYTMLEGRPVHYNFLLLNAQSIVRNINYKSIVNYIIDEDGYLGGAMETLKDYVLRSLTLQGAWYSRRANEFPKRVAAARMADKMSPAFVFDDNESQRIAKSVSVYCARTLDARKNITIVIGNGNGNGVGSMTAEQLSEALKEAVKQIEQAAKNVGVNNLPDRHNNSITSQAGKNEDAKKRERSKQGSDNANGKSNGDSIANAPGANSGKSDLSAAKCDIEAIERERKRNVATAQANNEANDKLRQEGKEVGREIGTNIYVRRAAEVPQSNIETYNRLSAGLLSITKNLERRLKTTIRDEENDDTVAGLPMGSRVEARLAYHQDGKIFSRKNFPRDNPRLAVGYLCDESGSMSKTAISASVRTAIILQDLCERMELPCYICGFTTEDLKGVDIITYVDMNVDGKDKYRTTGMASRGGTPTVPAMKYMGKKLMKDSTEKKILIVSTDGCSGQGYGETVRDVIKKLQHDGVMVIGAGIGDSKPRIQEEFGSNYLDISNLDAMPKILCNIVKKNLV